MYGPLNVRFYYRKPDGCCISAFNNKEMHWIIIIIITIIIIINTVYNNVGVIKIKYDFLLL